MLLIHASHAAGMSAGSGDVDDGGLGEVVVEAEDLGTSIWARTRPSSARTNA